MTEHKSRTQRIERTGRIGRLTPRVETFLKDALDAKSLDDDGDVETRPDFVCLRGLLLVEIKSLETDPSERLENALHQARESGNWPAFYGEWPLESVLRHMDEPEKIKKKVFDRLGRTVQRVIKKANDQLEQYHQRNSRRNIVRLLFLLNEDIPEYTPDTVAHIVDRELNRKRDDGTYRNGSIDAVVFMSERHAAPLNNQVCFPLVVVDGASLILNPWKSEVIKLILARWAKSQGAPLSIEEGFETSFFQEVEHIPESMKKHEFWALTYRRRPYMRKWKDSELRNLWDHVMLLSYLWARKDSPIKVPQKGVEEVLERFTHLQQEIAKRG